MFIKNYITLLLSILLATLVLANSNEQDSANTKTLKDFMMKGHFHGHSRSFFMATDNAPALIDYHALAIGAGIGYESAKLYGFQFGISGFFISKIWSNQLGAIDPQSGSRSRYELGNFDIQAPENHNNLNRLENFNIKYYFGKSRIIFGKQNLKTPFINPQDGRMRPTLEDGLWIEIKELEKLQFNGGWIHGISPRSTFRWFSVGKSIGTYPLGNDLYGNPSNYRNQLSSRGVAIANISYTPIKELKINVWNYYVENIFNTAFAQIDGQIPVNKKKEKAIVLGIQGGYQNALNNGGNVDSLRAYLHKDSESVFYSLRAGYKTSQFEFTLNYTHIADKDRFLMPREWGIEPFYTFLPRERMEGSANSRAMVLKSEFKIKKNLHSGIAYGYFFMPDVKKHVAQNKYTMPSFNQLNVFLNYEFDGYLKGFNIQVLYVYKDAMGNTYNEGRYIANKVNMSNYNLIINYHF